jgi:hypothetical protein
MTMGQSCVVNLALRTAPYVSVAGLMGVAANVMLGFEEPSYGFLVACLAAALAAPVFVLCHLALTRELSRDEKRAWLRTLAGWGAASAWSTYTARADRSEALREMRKAEKIR